MRQTAYQLAVPTREHTADFLTLAGPATVRFRVQSTPVVFSPDTQSFHLVLQRQQWAPVGIGPHTGTIARPKSVVTRLDSITCGTRELACPMHYFRTEHAFVDFDLPA